MLSKNDIFKILVENSSDGLALFEHKELVYASESMNDIFGCADFNVLRSYGDVLARVHPDDLPALRKMRDIGIKKKLKNQRYHFRFRRDDGTYCWVENTVTRFFDDAGENYRNALVCRDISEIKQTEEALKESQQLFKTIADNTPALIFIKDLEGRFVFVNKAFETTFGTPSEKIIGLKDENLTSEAESNKYRENDLQVIQSGKPVIIEEQLNLPSGMTTAISAKVPIFDLNNKVSGICGISTDITQQKKNEKQLSELKDKLELALRVGKMGIWEWYVEGNRVEWYADHAKLFGISNIEFSGKIDDVRELIHPDDQNKGISIFEKSIQENIPYSFTYRVIWPDKSLHWLSSVGNPVYDENGKAIKITGITRDVTTEKQSLDKIISQNRELSRINATKDKLFSIISHDLMNPLNSLLGFTQLLSINYRNESTEKIGQYAHLISRSANAMADLLQTLSQWSKSQHRKIKVSPREINPKQLINDLSELLFASIRNKNLTLVNEIPEEATAYLDEDMVKTILRNFLTNAIKFSHPGGMITCSGANRNGIFIFRVSDLGLGIRPEKLKTIFSVLENGSEAGTAGEKGSGLGLIICKELADLNHGRVWAESERGNGADFYLEIPASKTTWEKTMTSRRQPAS